MRHAGAATGAVGGAPHEVSKRAQARRNERAEASGTDGRREEEEEEAERVMMLGTKRKNENEEKNAWRCRFKTNPTTHAGLQQIVSLAQPNKTCEGERDTNCEYPPRATLPPRCRETV